MGIARQPFFPFAAFAFALGGGFLTAVVIYTGGLLNGIGVAFLVVILFVVALSDEMGR